MVRLKALYFLKHGIPNPRPREVRGWTIYPPLAAVPTLMEVAAFPTAAGTASYLNPWEEESALFFLTALATYSRKEAFGNGFNWAGSMAHDFFNSRREEVRAVLAHAKPAWLSDWIMINGNSLADYWVLRGLEDDGFIEYRPQDFAFRLAWLAFEQDLSELRVQLAQDKLALTRDIPNQFEFELSIARLDGRSAANYEKFTWLRILVDLIAAGHLNRLDLLTRCLLALRRDFRRPILTWYVALYQDLRPTLTERLAMQDQLAELLAHPQALVVNFALDQLKDLLPEPGFTLAPLLLIADSLLIRPDLKTGLRTLLTSLGKLPQHTPAHAPAVARLLAAALAHPDAAVQERAAKGLAALLSAKKPLLAAQETSEITATINQQADLLGAAARPALAAWLTATKAITISNTVTYQPLPEFIPNLSPATAIAPVADWHELLFLTGQVLRHDDPAATERWLDGLLRLHGQLPAGHAAQLQPYLVQVLPQLKKANAAEAAALLAGPIGLAGHQGLPLALLLGWATAFATPRVSSVAIAGPNVTRSPLLALEQQRYQQAEAGLRAGPALPLLSTPTHRPHWVAPSALVNKLLTYQSAGVSPNTADLVLALTRAAHAHAAEAAAARQQLPQLAGAGLRQLLAWFFGAPGQPLPALAPASGRPAAPLTATVVEALPELWAVAARTKAPAADFPALAASLGYDYPGAAQPLRSTFEAVPHKNVYPDPSQPGQVGTYRFIELAWSSGALAAAPSPLLPYTPPVGKSGHGSWEENNLLASDLTFLTALLPGYAAPVYDQVLRCAAWADNLETTERDVLAQALRTLLGPGPALPAAATAVLASGLIHHTSPCRSLAQEVLLQAIAHGRLRPAPLGRLLGQQLAIGYAPATRLIANFLPIKGIDALTDDALRQTLAALLPALPAPPPRNTRPLLETYADLLARTRQPVPAGVQAQLGTWQATPSLRKICRTLLAQHAA